MAKTKKRAAARKKTAKRSKASVKPARKKAAKAAQKKTAQRKPAKRKTAKPAVTKNAKSKVRRSAKKVATPVTEELQPQQLPAPENALELEKPVETTIVAVIEDPVPAVDIEEVIAVTTASLAVTTATLRSALEEGAPTAEDDIWSDGGEASEKKVA